jgi:hypothetical protein
VTRCLAGSPLPKGLGVRLDKTGLPVILPVEMRRQILTKDPEKLRFIITLLTFTRSYELKPEEDVKSITDE